MNMIVRRNPTWMWNAFDKMFEDGFNEFRDTDSFPLALDVKETDGAYLISTALPGVTPEDIEITLHDEILTISAESQAAESQEGEKQIMRERRYGKFGRSLRLNTKVDSSNIEANYSNGVLTVTLPKVEEAQPKTISVKVNN